MNYCSVLVGIAVALVGAGCRPAGSRVTPDGTTVVRLAYFPNVTHAVALVGSQRRFFSDALGSGVKLEEQVFNAGPAEIEALFGDQVDIGYIGPGPALNAFLKSRGKALRIIAGASSGGAALVVRADSGIQDTAGLAGKRVATPQTGGTQDISLRHALLKSGLKTTDKGGSVTVLPMANPDTLTLFVKKDLDAAWVPEPWVTRLVKEGNGKILVDERDHWPKRQFATTVVIVRNQFLVENRPFVDRFMEAHLDTIDWMRMNPEEARNIVGEQIAKLTRKPLPKDVLAESIARTDFTFDPLVDTVLTFADRAQELQYLREGRYALAGIFELQPLNAALSKRGERPVH